MSAIICFATVLISIHAANSYVLLTANVDDFPTIGKEIASSPLVAELKEMYRRASAIFNETLSKPRQRSERFQDDSLEVWKPDAPNSESASEQDSLSEKDEAYLKARDENLVERRKGEDDLVALGKTASYYLQSLKSLIQGA